MIPREYHHISAIDVQHEADYMHDDFDERTTPVPQHEANTISSLIAGQSDDLSAWEELHAPVLDIDFPCVLIPSSTPGHFHLYLEKPVKWIDYQVLLSVLADAGIIERGYANASIERGRTYVRKPDVMKPSAEPELPDPPADVAVENF